MHKSTRRIPRPPPQQVYQLTFTCLLVQNTLIPSIINKIHNHITEGWGNSSALKTRKNHPCKHNKQAITR